ncbi:hypothetical protein D3C72_1750600 [compost metagenome]
MYRSCWRVTKPALVRVENSKFSPSSISNTPDGEKVIMVPFSQRSLMSCGALLLTMVQVCSSILPGPRGCHTRKVFCPGRKDRFGNTLTEEIEPIILERNSPRRSATFGWMLYRYLRISLSPSVAALPTTSRLNSQPWPLKLTW